VALDWLRADLDAYIRLLEIADIRQELRDRLTHWQKDADLASVRDPKSLSALPEAELIRGRTLAQLLQERPSPTHDLPGFLAIFGQLCQTIAYAHNRHILHRDLKPSNVMVGAFGEVQVMDWGLTKVLEERDGAGEGRGQQQDVSAIHTAQGGADTQAGTVLGTPAYMAPEQALGEVHRLDRRADVFALGALLCEILTGRPPYTAENQAAVRRRAARADLADAFARLDGCGADAELVALAKRCLATDPGERPRDAGALAAELTAYLEGVERRLRRAELERAGAEARAEEAKATAQAEQARAKEAEAREAAERRQAEEAQARARAEQGRATEAEAKEAAQRARATEAEARAAAERRARRLTVFREFASNRRRAGSVRDRRAPLAATPQAALRPADRVLRVLEVPGRGPRTATITHRL
jgi:hypothetical protein